MDRGTLEYFRTMVLPRAGNIVCGAPLALHLSSSAILEVIPIARTTTLWTVVLVWSELAQRNRCYSSYGTDFNGRDESFQRNGDLESLKGAE